MAQRFRCGEAHKVCSTLISQTSGYVIFIFFKELISNATNTSISLDIIKAVYPGYSEESIRQRTTQFEFDAFSKARNSRQYCRNIANRISEAEQQMAALLVSNTSSLQQITVPERLTNTNANPISPSSHLSASHTATNSTSLNTIPRSSAMGRGRGRGRGRPRGRGTGRRGRPRKAMSKQARASSANISGKPNLPYNTKSLSAVDSGMTTSVTQSGKMIAPEASCLNQGKDQDQKFVNRQKEKPMFHAQRKQQVAVNNHREQQDLASLQQQSKIIGQSTNKGFLPPAGLRQTVESSTQIHQPTQSRSANIPSSTQTDRMGVLSSAAHQKLVALRGKYSKVFELLLPHLYVYVNAHAETKRDAVRKELYCLNAMFNCPVIPGINTALFIDQQANLIVKLINYFKPYFGLRVEGTNATESEKDRATVGARAQDDRIDEKILLDNQNSPNLIVRKSTKPDTVTQKNHESRDLNQTTANEQASAQAATQVQRAAASFNQVAIQPARNLKLLDGSSRDVSIPERRTGFFCTADNSMHVQSQLSLQNSMELTNLLASNTGGKLEFPVGPNQGISQSLHQSDLLTSQNKSTDNVQQLQIRKLKISSKAVLANSAEEVKIRSEQNPNISETVQDKNSLICNKHGTEDQQLRKIEATNSPFELVLSNSGTIIEKSAACSETMSLPKPMIDLQISKKNSTYGQNTERIVAGNHVSTDSRKIKLTNMDEQWVEEILTRVTHTLKNVEKFLAMESMKEKAATAQRVNDTFQALQKMAERRKIDRESEANIEMEEVNEKDFD